MIAPRFSVLAVALCLAGGSAHAAPSQRQPQRWVTGDRATLRTTDAGLESFCRQAVPLQAAAGMRAPSNAAEFDAWLARLKNDKPELAKCYDPGQAIPSGAAVTLLDSERECGGALVRVRLQDGRVGCTNVDFLTDHQPKK